MRSLTRFEHNMLRIAYCLVGQATRAEAVPLMRGGQPRPPCLSRDCVELLQAALAKGSVRLLARGGWRRERFLRGERADPRPPDPQPIEGRLWRRWRSEELGMGFSPAAVELLLWLTSRGAGEPGTSRTKKKKADGSGTLPATLGDQFLAFLAFRAVEGTPVAAEMSRLPMIAGNALCRLAWPEEFAGGSQPPLDWSPWVNGPGVPVFEALQHELVERWVRMEQGKMQLTRTETILNVGLAQRHVLEKLLDALEKANRRDLARFLLMAGARLLHRAPAGNAWLARMQTGGLTMGQRAAVAAAAFAFLRVFDRLEQWERQARTVGYFDEGYAASQLWKSDWERYGGAACSVAARAIIRESDPLRAQAVAAVPAAEG